MPNAAATASSNQFEMKLEPSARAAHAMLYTAASTAAHTKRYAVAGVCEGYGRAGGDHTNRHNLMS